MCRRNETRVNGLSINESDHERGGVRTRYIMHNAGRQEVQGDLAGAGDGRGERGEGRMNESTKFNFRVRTSTRSRGVGVPTALTNSRLSSFNLPSTPFETPQLVSETRPSPFVWRMLYGETTEDKKVG